MLFVTWTVALIVFTVSHLTIYLKADPRNKYQNLPHSSTQGTLQK